MQFIWNALEQLRVANAHYNNGRNAISLIAYCWREINQLHKKEGWSEEDKAYESELKQKIEMYRELFLLSVLELMDLNQIARMRDLLGRLPSSELRTITEMQEKRLRDPIYYRERPKRVQNLS